MTITDWRSTGEVGDELGRLDVTSTRASWRVEGTTWSPCFALGHVPRQLDEQGPGWDIDLALVERTLCSFKRVLDFCYFVAWLRFREPFFLWGASR